MAEALQARSPATHSPSRWETLRTSKRWQRGIRHTLSYVVLILGSMFMLFPMLWMLSASLKPSWQIFTDPPIWIPQEWEQVQAGSTNRQISLWTVDFEGEQRTVVQIGTRRYTTVVDAALLHTLQAAPNDQVGTAATATLDNGVNVNLRDWNGQQVVALARGDGDTLVVAALDDILPALSRVPLDEVNSGRRASLTVEGVDFRGRSVTVETEAGEVTLDLIPIGPETELTIVSTPDVAANATIVPSANLSDAGFAEIGDTELRLVHVQDDPTNYVALVTETWQPVINEDELDAKAFLAASTQLGERLSQQVNGVELLVAPFSPEEGDGFDVGILVSGTTQSLVMPVAQIESLRLAQAGGLTSARGDTFRSAAYRVQDGFDDGGGTNSVALVGDQREMALIVPEAAITDAFDVNPASLERAMHVQLRFAGYQQALETKVAETRFPTFFRNSFVLVALNTIGHLLSCIVVAYAFARLRAPGKGMLFLILLSTMMLPFPVTLVPVYELFRDLGMINTLWPLFLRSYFGNAFLIFMLRQFFISIPRELEEAARIDGANVLQVIGNVIIPLSRPAIATVVIFTFWWTWNSFLEPFIYLTSPELFPVSVGLNFFKDQYGTIYYDRMISASVLSMVPMLLIFFFAQRYFIEGIQLTGMKG